MAQDGEGLGARIGRWLLEWLKERMTEPVFQGRSLDETRELIRLLTLVMKADGDDSTAEQQLVEFLVTHLPKSWRLSGGQPLWQVISAEGDALPGEAERLRAATQAAEALSDPDLRMRAFEMAEMIFQATPTPPAVYRRWHQPLADALQIPPDQREQRAAAAASDYQFRLRHEVADLFAEEEDR